MQKLKATLQTNSEFFAGGLKLENPPDLNDSNFFELIGNTTVYMYGPQNENGDFVIDHGDITMGVYKGKTGTNYKGKYYVYYIDDISVDENNELSGEYTGVYEVGLGAVFDLGTVTIDLGIITGKIFDSFPSAGREESALDLQINPKGDYDLVKFTLTETGNTDNFIYISHTGLKALTYHLTGGEGLDETTPNPNSMLDLKAELYQLYDGKYYFMVEADVDDTWEGFYMNLGPGEYYMKVYQTPKLFELWPGHRQGGGQPELRLRRASGGSGELLSAPESTWWLRAAPGGS